MGIEHLVVDLLLLRRPCSCNQSSMLRREHLCCMLRNRGLERPPHRSPIPLDLALVFVARRSHSSTFRQRSLHEGRRTFLLFLGVGLARSRAGSSLLRGQIDCK